MITQNLPQSALSTAIDTGSNTASDVAAESRNLYHAIQVAGLVAPLVGSLSQSHSLDAIWVVAFPFADIAHPTRPTLTLRTVIRRAELAGTKEHLRVDSLESARSALVKASDYSDWTAASYAPLLELLDIAIAQKRAAVFTR